MATLFRYFVSAMLPVCGFANALMIDDPSWNKALVSAYAINTKTGEVIVDQQSDKSMVPASCVKAITTAVALQILGPEMRFQTDLEYDGVIEGGTLHGNLYIRGGGDPCLGSERVALAWDKQIETWIEAIQKLGVKKIQGEVIGDASRWEKALAPASWQWGDLGNYYGAGACALSFHENSYTLTFKPGKEGEPATIVRQEPEIPGLVIHNEVTTGPVGSGDQAWIYGSEYSMVQHVRGTVPAGIETFSIRGSIPDPAKVCGCLLEKALEKRGIEVVRQKREGGKRTVFHTTQSPTMKEIVYWTNQKSINLYAEHLLKKMGEVVFKEGSTKAGIRAVKEFLQSKKIDLEGFQLDDGSGLSRRNLVTAKQFVALLSQIKTTEVFPIFMQSLVQVADHVKAKDGWMTLIRGYVGYADEVVFAMIVNQCLDPQLPKKMKALVSELTPPEERP
ncbi:MAG TPA: D-alanyl-D-alanine carboxypeptidase/D-alanyl-D-alanine-endopeptidase [Rhabdochlamydiaceae bacterium]|nr:D-alanyl-D-alanine carboxypeptidase/D-alanyl-D-alanine-endopeptidase [Rhabdochlamydiaceae bacterium]